MDPRHNKTLRILPPCFSRAMLVLLPLVLLVAVILVVYPTEFALRSPASGLPCQNDNASHVVDVEVARVAPDFRLLIGVLTLPGLYERRNLLRMVYALQQPNLTAVRIDVRFFFCRLASEEQRVLVALEAMRFGDVVELDCLENMDNGKTYAYFSSVPALFGESAYDFVMKTDDDTFFRLPQLAESLRRAPREDLYYGRRVPCKTRRADKDEYMNGMGYVLPWDLVEWIVAAAELIRSRTAGPEDWIVRTWFGLAGKAKNWVDVNPAIYNFPQKYDHCAHELVPDTIAVHGLKTNERWAKTLKYFNFTAGLQPTKFYRNE